MPSLTHTKGKKDAFCVGVLAGKFFTFVIKPC